MYDRARFAVPVHERQKTCEQETLCITATIQYITVNSRTQCMLQC
jgi:hypothetical protein